MKNKLLLTILLISGLNGFSQTHSQAVSEAVNIPARAGNADSRNHFEGTVTYKIQFADDDHSEAPPASDPVHAVPNEFTLYVKGHQTRLEVSSKRSDVTVIGSSADSVYTLLEIMGRKIALRMDAGQMKAAQERLGQFRLIHLEGKREILGYECGRALMIREGSADSSEVWYTSELPPIGIASGEFLPRMENDFPMEITMENEGVQLTMRVQEITPGPLAEDLFDIPSGYKIVDADGLRQGLKMLISP